MERRSFVTAGVAAGAAALTVGQPLAASIRGADPVFSVKFAPHFGMFAGHAGDGSGAQRKDGKTTVAAEAAHRRSGRKLVTGVQVLAFPTE